MKKILLVVIVFLGGLFLYNQSIKKNDQNDENLSKNNLETQSPSRGIASVPDPAVSLEQQNFDEKYPPPQDGRAIAQLPNQFDSFDKVKSYYHLTNKKLHIDDKNFYQSKLRTLSIENEFNPELGKLITTIHGYYVFFPLNKQVAEKNTPLLVDEQTWMPTIITGKIYVKYTDGNHGEMIARTLHDLHYNINFHHKNINIYEVQINNLSETLRERKKLQDKFEKARVTIELKSSEYFPI
ncbi:MAG: hypothetical protein H6621_02665 [Halobacteriovoraceae bacterium]|nr:hypothetical protein [Halobacteriovoraceae bacterium]MCB9093946.1 hypothetical protein [Halobacteriovoraceae bacterium]